MFIFFSFFFGFHFFYFLLFTRHPLPATRHPLPATRHPSPVTRNPRKSPADWKWRLKVKVVCNASNLNSSTSEVSFIQTAGLQWAIS